MGKRVTSASGRKWQRYNRWRAGHRELDRKRRLAKIAAKAALHEANRPNETHGLPSGMKRATSRRLKPLFVVTIRCRDGAVGRLVVHEHAMGRLSISATAVGAKVACVLREYRPAPLGHRRAAL